MLHRFAAVALLAACTGAHASFHAFQVNEIYSRAHAQAPRALTHDARRLG
jgi:hypothetical protein